MRRDAPTLVVLVAVACAFAGCKCGRDRPYVPYAIGDGATAGGTAANGGALGGPDGSALLDLPDAGVAFAEEPGVLAPPNVSQWNFGGAAVVAPAETVFVVGVARDVDGDGAPDVLAVVRPTSTTPEAADHAQLVFYRSGGAPNAAGVPVGAPIALAAESSCASAPSSLKQPPKQRLAFVGRTSAVVELSGACPPRWLGVVSLGKGAPRVTWSTTIADPAGAPALSVGVDGSDRDGDGLADVAVRVTLEGGGAPFEPGPRVGLLLKWFDRPAGMSRDPEEPDASLRALAGQAVARAARVKDAPTVPPLVRQLRAAFGAICAEGGATRLGTKTSCGPSRGLEEAGLAEVRAYVTMGDAFRAVSAFERAQRPPATRTASRVTEAQSWIAQVAPAASSATLRVVAAVPALDRGHAPSWSALAFEPSGKLLVRTSAGFVRVDPAAGDETEAADVAPASWRAAVLSPDGAYQLAEVYGACDGFALRATFAPRASADGEPKELALPIAPPLGVRCTSGKGESVPVLPIAWGASGLEVIVAGEPILVAPDLSRASALMNMLEQPGALGSPRAPGGKTIVVPTTLGLLVRASGKTRMLRAKELDGGYAEIRDCVVTDDGTRVACVRGGRAFVGTWE